MGIFSWIFQGVWTKGFNLRSYVGVMLIDSIRMKRTNRPLRKAYKRLKNNYTSSRIAKLQRKYLSAKASPSTWLSRRRIRNFQADLTNLVQNLLNDYKIFREYIAYCFQRINETLASGQRQQYQDMSQIGVLFMQMWVKRAGLVFPKETVEEFRIQSIKLFKHLEKNLSKDASSTTRVQRGGHPAGVNLWNPMRWWSLGKLYVKEKRSIIKLGRYLDYYNKLISQLEVELGTTGIRQDFLLLLIETMRNVDAANKRFEFIYEDVQEIVRRLRNEIEKVKEEVSTFVELLKNEPQIQGSPLLNGLQEDIKKLEEYISGIESNAYRNTQALMRNLKKIETGESGLLRIMEAYAK